MAVDEDWASVGDCEYRTAGFFGSGEGGDDCGVLVSGALEVERREDVPPRISTMPVNILADGRV